MLAKVFLRDFVVATVAVLPLLMLPHAGAAQGTAENVEHVSDTAQSGHYSFDMPGQTLGAALESFSATTKIQYFFADDGVLQASANPVKGNYAPLEALKKMVAGTPYDVRFTDENTVILYVPGETSYSLQPRTMAVAQSDQASDAQGAGQRAVQVAADEEWAAIGAASGQPAEGAPGTADQGQGVLEEIMITGTRIQRTGMTTPTPVTMMEAGELDNMAPGLLINALDQLPQFLNNDNALTTASKGDSAGAANVNLRGLNPKRTLVLLDSRRVVPSNRLGIVDINLFPEAILERVEVVTGGASAAYGTDAVAGVVNFILDTDFTGVKGNLQGGITSRGDRDNYEVSLAAGTPIGDRMHLVVAGDYYEAQRIDNLAGRDWFQEWGLVTNPAWQAALEAGECEIGVECPAGPQRLIRRDVKSTTFTDGGLIDAPGSAIDRLFFTGDGTPAPFVLGDPAAFGFGTNSHSITNGGTGFNPFQFDTSVSTENFPQGTRSGSFYPDTRRRTAFAHLDYDVTDNFTVFAQGIWGMNRTNSVGTLPITHGSRALTIFRENAFLPESIRNVMAAEDRDSFQLQRYNTARDIGQDRFIMENNTYSITVGFDGEFDDGVLAGWQVSGYYQGGWNHNRIDLKDNIRRDRLPLAVDAVVDPATGATVCNVTRLNPGGPYDDCVPINLFGTGQASPEAIDWVLGDMVIRANTRQHNAELAANGEVFEGWGAGAISVAAGVSYREQSVKHMIGPDNVVNQPGLANDPANGIRGIPPAWVGVDDFLQFVTLDNYQGSFNVKEAFAETLIPLISDEAFAQQLNLNLAGRWADYTGSGSIWAWKAGLDWQATTDLRLRGTVSRDIRAASLEERFDSQGQAAAVVDPVLNDLSYSTNQIRGGNPSVNPEKADTITIGAVYQPTYVDGLSVSLDWYSIKVDDAIDLLDVQTIVDQCFDTGNPEFCDRITRDSDSQLITLVQNTFINVNKQKVSGVDLEVVYNRQMELFGGGAETVNARFLGSWLDEHSVTLFQQDKQNFVGQMSSLFPGFALPEFRWTANVTYSNGPFTVFLQERYIDSGVNDVTWTSGVQIEDNTVSAAYYTDLRLSYAFEQSAGEWEVFFNVTNLFDENPPLIPSWSVFVGTNFGANERLHDLLGRLFTAGVRFRY